MQEFCSAFADTKFSQKLQAPKAALDTQVIPD